jgi:hypothetical protein
MFNGSSNLFSSLSGIQGPYLIGLDQAMNFEFLIQAHDVELGDKYQSSLFISYKDSLGKLYPFDSEREIPINLQVALTNVEEPDFNGTNPGDNTSDQDTNEKTDITIKQEGSNNNQYFLALLILGIFILVSTVIFSLTHFKVANKNKQKPDNFPREEEPRLGSTQPVSQYKAGIQSHKLNEKSTEVQSPRSTPSSKRPITNPQFQLRPAQTTQIPNQTSDTITTIYPKSPLTNQKDKVNTTNLAQNPKNQNMNDETPKVSDSSSTMVDEKLKNP